MGKSEPKSGVRYTPEFRRQIVELVRATSAHTANSSPIESQPGEALDSRGCEQHCALPQLFCRLVARNPRCADANGARFARPTSLLK